MSPMRTTILFNKVSKYQVAELLTKKIRAATDDTRHDLVELLGSTEPKSIELVADKNHLLRIYYRNEGNINCATVELGSVHGPALADHIYAYNLAVNAYNHYGVLTVEYFTGIIYKLMEQGYQWSAELTDEIIQAGADDYQFDIYQPNDVRKFTHLGLTCMQRAFNKREIVMGVDHRTAVDIAMPLVIYGEYFYINQRIPSAWMTVNENLFEADNRPVVTGDYYFIANGEFSVRDTDIDTEYVGTDHSTGKQYKCTMAGVVEITS